MGKNINSFSEKPEAWKAVPLKLDIEGYEVSNKGNIRYNPSGRPGRGHVIGAMKKLAHKNGKYFAKLPQNGKRKEFLISRLVYRAFIGEIPPRYGVVHRNGDKHCDEMENLILMTLKESGRKYGGNARRRPVAKITPEGEIIAVYGSAQAASEAEFFCAQTIGDYCNGRVVNKFFHGYSFVWDD